MKICICNSCGKNEGTIHVSVTVVLFSAKSRRQKVIQFWLCEPCEMENRAFLERDNTLRDRVAKALTPARARYPKFQWMTEPETAPAGLKRR